jgi:hypothetical protein
MKITALTISQLQSMTDRASRERVTEHGCRAYAHDANVIDGLFTFATQCNTSNNEWVQQIQFRDWQDIVPPDIDPNMPLMTVIQQYPEVLQLHVLVDCSCPAFSYWGHKYNLQVQNPGSALIEATPPGINNPDERFSCKHLSAVYNTFF